MLFTVASLFIEIHPDIRRGIFFIVNHGIHVEYRTDLVLFCFYCFTVYFAIAVVSVPMFFRYLVVCRSHVPNLRQLLIMIATAAAVASTVPMTIAATWLPSSLRLSSERAETIASIHCHDPGEMPLFVLEDIFGANGLVFLVASCVITATYVTVVFCARRVCTEVSKLRRQLTTQSALTGHNIQRQLNYALTFQAMTPFFIIVLPFFSMLIVVLSGLEHLNNVVLAVTSFLSWIPVLNASAAIFFIKPYRQTVLTIFRSVLTVKIVPWLVSPTEGRSWVLSSSGRWSTMQSVAG